MCHPEIDILYDNYLKQLEILRIEITDVLCLKRDIHDRYQRIHANDKNGLNVSVYISMSSKQIVKILINYNVDRDMPVISVLAEDESIKLFIESNPAYKEIDNLLTQIKHHKSLDRLYTKLTYNI